MEEEYKYKKSGPKIQFHDEYHKRARELSRKYYWKKKHEKEEKKLIDLNDAELK